MPPAADRLVPEYELVVTAPAGSVCWEISPARVVGVGHLPRGAASRGGSEHVVVEVGVGVP